MQSLGDGLLLEGRLQVRNVWALVLAATLVLALLAGSHSVLGWAKTMRPTLEAISQQQGAQFSSWLAHDHDALPFRNDLSTLQPRMGVNLALAITGALGPLLAAVWGARAVGTEFGQRTVRVRAAHEGWLQAVARKQIVMAIVVVVAVCLVLLLGVSLGHAVWASFSSNMPELSSIDLAPLPFSPALGALAVSLGMVAYGLVGCLAALVTRSTAAGIVLAVAIPYLERYAGVWWLPQAAYGYLLRHWLAYYEGSFIVAPGTAHAPASAAAAAAIMAAWLVALAGGVLLLARRQEIA